MKCPKCGFTSFDFLENCKKCGVDLQTHKSKFGLRSLIYPGFQAADSTPTLLEAVSDELPDEPAATEAGDFGFDFMSEEEPALETDENAELDAFSEEPADADEEFWNLDEDSTTLTEAPAEELAEELSDPEAEFSFDNWEDEETPDEKPPAGKEGPSDPFEVRESAVREQAPEQFRLTETAERPAVDPARAANRAESPVSPVRQLLEPDPAHQHAGAPEPEWFYFVATDPPTAPPNSASPAEHCSENQAGSDVPGRVARPELFADDPPNPETAVELFPADQPEIPDDSELLLFDEPEVPDAPELFPAAAPETLNDNDVLFIDEPEVPDDPRLLFADPPEIVDDAEEDPAPLSTAIPADLEELVPSPPLSARIFACLTDLVLLAAIFGIFLMVGEMTVPDPHGQRLLPSPATLLELAVPYFLVLFALCFGYFTLFHFLTGQTPGKMLFRLRVESITGEALLFSQAFLRSTGGLISLLCAGLGYLVAAFNPHGRGWNDQLAGSRLVELLGEEIDAEDLAASET